MAEATTSPQKVVVTKEQNDFMRFQQNLKKTALGVRFGKKLFTNPNAFTPKDITLILKTLGLNIPKEVQLTADLAQVYCSGSAMVVAYDNYQAVDNAKNLNSMVSTSAATSKLATNLAEDQGWIDSDSASMVRVGTNIAMIYASGGTNVAAWMSLAMEFGIQSMGAQTKAEMIAKRGVIDWYRNQVSSQATNLTANMKKLQNKEYGLFGFLSESSINANVLFENAIIRNENLVKMLPGLNFVPVFESQYRFNSSVTTWYGDTKTASEVLNFRTLPKITDIKTAHDFIFKYVVEPYTKDYLRAENWYYSRGKAGLFSTSILAMIEGDGYFDKNQNFTDLLVKHMLTPSDLGDVGAFNYYSKGVDSGALEIGGKSLSKALLTREQLNKLEDAADIQTILSDRNAKDFLKSRFTFDFFPIETSTQAKIDWREAQNFIACLDYLDLVFSDQSYIAGENSTIEQYRELISVSDWKNLSEECYQKSLVRKTNKLALANVAYFLQVNQNQLKRLNQMEVGKVAIYGT